MDPPDAVEQTYIYIYIYLFICMYRVREGVRTHVQVCVCVLICAGMCACCECLACQHFKHSVISEESGGGVGGGCWGHSLKKSVVSNSLAV